MRWECNEIVICKYNPHENCLIHDLRSWQDIDDRILPGAIIDNGKEPRKIFGFKCPR